MSRALLNQILFIGFALAAGPSIARAGDARLTFDSNVKVSILTKEGPANDAAFSPGAEVSLKPDLVYWITSPGKVPLLVTPQAPSDASAAHVSLPDVANWPSDVSAQQLQTKLASTIDDLYAFQSAIARKDTAEAERVLAHMEVTQPMEYYAFLRASVAFLKGDMKNAKDQVQRGLRRYPANEQGTRLLKTIEGIGK